MLFTYSRRSGPMHPLRQRSRLSPLEFVETLGGLYKRARASGFALEVNYGRFRGLVTRKLGLRRDATPEALADAVRERFGYSDTKMLETLKRCETAVNEHNLPDREALALTQALHAHARALRILPRSTEEKH